MKEKIIKSYINHLTKNDIVMFAQNNNVSLNNQEIDYLYNNIKNNYENILNNPHYYLNQAKQVLNTKAYNKLYELYTIYYPKLYH